MEYLEVYKKINLLNADDDFEKLMILIHYIKIMVYFYMSFYQPIIYLLCNFLYSNSWNRYSISSFYSRGSRALYYPKEK